MLTFYNNFLEGERLAPTKYCCCVKNVTQLKLIQGTIEKKKEEKNAFWNVHIVCLFLKTFNIIRISINQDLLLRAAVQVQFSVSNFTYLSYAYTYTSLIKSLLYKQWARYISDGYQLIYQSIQRSLRCKFQSFYLKLL